MNESDDFTGSPRWSSAYGLPEKIWIAFWVVMTAAWIVNADAIPEFTTTLTENLALLALLLLVPQLTVRMGRIPYDLMRAAFSLLSAYLAYERIATFTDLFRERSYEYEMLKIDEFLFGGHASIWMENLHHPLLSEYLQAVYLFYFPNMLVVGLGILMLRREKLFFEYLVTMNIALIVTHVFYFIVPLRSPFYIEQLGLYPEMLQYGRPLEGLWFFSEFRASLLEATTMRHDCFPSGHTMHSLIAVFFAFRARKALGVYATIIAGSIIFSTLYLRYHYLIDLVAGVGIGVVITWFGIWAARRAWAHEPNPRWTLPRRWALGDGRDMS